MRVTWHVDARDVGKVQRLLEAFASSKMLVRRKENYRRRTHRQVGRATFWKATIVGLVTSQQPSGPGSKVRLFLAKSGFPLSYPRCKRARRLRPYVEKEIRRAGLRFRNVLAERIAQNFHAFEAGLWPETDTRLEELRRARSGGQSRLLAQERDVAEFLSRSYVGIGPKQSRNLLQYLGLTKYEIPLDSRLMKWLNEFGFPVELSAAGLADRHYYNFVLDAVQELCDKSGVEPYLFDAAVFSSFDE